MTSAPTKPIDVPPFQLQTLIAQCNARCAQALGSEIYVGCANGELIRFALQADDPNTLEAYSIISRHISRALVLSDHQIHFYTLPALDANHLKRPAPSLSNPAGIEPVDLCVIKRSSIAMYGLRERLFYQKEIPLQNGALLARRSGQFLCPCGGSLYGSPWDLHHGRQPYRVSHPSWTGASTLGVFVSGGGDPVRGTLEWPAHPRAVVFDYPYVAALLPNRTVEIHSIESQSIVQVLPAPNNDVEPRVALVAALSGYLVPSTQKSEKMRKIPVGLLR
ncbi:hypothetical protein B0H13DRAFT_2653488 [Mycena leptocephala]|nr:hypothetical protein B0H13DRAFT_2653488 [Mycena leptocephala]